MRNVHKFGRPASGEFDRRRPPQKNAPPAQESHQKDNKTDLVYRQHRMHL